MKEIGSKIVMALVILIAIGAVGYGMKEYRQHTAEDSVQDNLHTLEAEFDQTVANDTSNRTDTEKLHDAAHEKVSDRLGEVADGNSSKDDREYSAGVFSGQYGRITVVTYDYCKTLGVDISKFANAYKSMHKDVYVRAEAVLNSGGNSVKKTYTASAPMTLKYVKKEVDDIRTMIINETGDNTIGLGDACNYYNLVADNPEIMESVSFRTAVPDAYKILMN